MEITSKFQTQDGYNYIVYDNGLIQQEFDTLIDYNNDYIDPYNQLGIKLDIMSSLRLGYIIGSIGKTPRSILDVGYGNGSFLLSCKKTISNCYGNDISGYSIPDDCTFVENILDDWFEVITFFDVLEHFEDISFIGKLNCKYLCISLPWCHFFDKDW